MDELKPIKPYPNLPTGTLHYMEFKYTDMTVTSGEWVIKPTKEEFQVGDEVGINHKKVNPNDRFTIIKINNKNIKVKGGNGMMNVSPGLLVKI